MSLSDETKPINVATPPSYTRQMPMPLFPRIKFIETNPRSKHADSARASGAHPPQPRYPALWAVVRKLEENRMLDKMKSHFANYIKGDPGGNKKFIAHFKEVYGEEGYRNFFNQLDEFVVVGAFELGGENITMAELKETIAAELKKKVVDDLEKNNAALDCKTFGTGLGNAFKKLRGGSTLEVFLKDVYLELGTRVYVAVVEKLFFSHKRHFGPAHKNMFEREKRSFYNNVKMPLTISNFRTLIDDMYKLKDEVCDKSKVGAVEDGLHKGSYCMTDTYRIIVLLEAACTEPVHFNRVLLLEVGRARARQVKRKAMAMAAAAAGDISKLPVAEATVANVPCDDPTFFAPPEKTDDFLPFKKHCIRA